MRQHSFATRSIRRQPRTASRATSRIRGEAQAALQVFVFRGETFLGTELFDASRPIMVGRHHDTQLRLDGETVSRYHLRISVIGDQVFVEDLDSGNGSLVNRKRLAARTALKSTDQVHVGPYVFRTKLLRAPGPRPYDPSLSEDTTKINAILAAERTGSGGTREVDVELEDSAPSLNEALYREALRRTTGAVRPQDPPAPAPQDEMEDDSTQMAADDIALSEADAPVPEVLETPNDEVEARLRDLDALIATLEAEDRGPSGAWPAENTAPTTTELDLEDAVFAPSNLSGPVDTREFARDLASRLALNGQVVEGAAAEAKIIPLRPDTRIPTPVPAEPLDEDEDPTEAELADEALDPALLAAADLDDEGPETDLLVGGVPPQIAPRILAESRARPATPSPVQERARELRDPAASGPSPVPPRGLSIPRPVPQTPADVAPTRPAPRYASQRLPSQVARQMVAAPPAPPAAPRMPIAPAPKAPQAAPPPLPRKRRRHHEARLMTPTSLRVDVTPMGKLDDSGLVADVFTQSDDQVSPAAPARPVPPPLPKRRRNATEAKPKSRIDDFSEAVKRLPDAPIPTHWDGIEIAARVNGQLVDISVLRAGGEEYILGHRTPQGAVAPARAHLGLRLVRVNPDQTIDLVFPRDVGGHLVRGASTVTFSDLAEGRKYSSLRLEDKDVATVVLGSGRDTITYHVRFLSRPKSLFRSLRGLRR